jgi:glycosyltransferase involved in cell wall biosynthesis
MRVGIDGSLLYGNYSGVEYAIWLLLKAIASREESREHEFVVYVPHDFRGDEPNPFHPLPQSADSNWRFVRAPFEGKQKLIRILWQQLTLPRRMKKDRLDLFHAPAYVLPLRASVPTVLTVYDAMAFTHPQFCTLANRLHYRRVMPLSAQKAQRVIVPSQAICDDLVNVLQLQNEKIQVIPLGVEDIFFEEPSRERQQAVKEKYQLPEQFFLFVGNVELKKNLSLLLGIWTKKLPPLVIAGTWLMGIELFGRFQNIKALGYVPREELPALYALATAFVFPSLYEGFGLPPLEAMACGTPVICSNAGALPEVVGTAAMLANPHEPSEWTLAMELIVKDASLRERLRRAGRERARQFTWERTARAVMAVYRSVIS